MGLLTFSACSPVDFKEGDRVKNENFTTSVDAYVGALSFF